MRRNVFAGALLGLAVCVLSTVPAKAQEFSGKFSGFNEIGALNNETGAIFSRGTGTIKLTLDRASQTITYEETFSGLSSPVTQSHIHFGKVHTPGNIMVFLCSNLGNGPAGTQGCPAAGGTITGTITAGSVLAIPTQNVPAGDFEALTAALFAHAAYANVHTTAFPGGELRAQLGDEHHRHHGDNNRDNDHQP